MSRNIIAILRGIEPNEVLEISKVIANSGINYIEVALNSPDAFESIRLLRNEFSGDIQIGAGTVTKIGEVLALTHLGVDFIVSPNFDPEVVKASKEAKIIRKKYKNFLIITPGIRMPGDGLNDQVRVMTPKDAFKNKVSGIVIGRALTKGNIKNNIKNLIKKLE